MASPHATFIYNIDQKDNQLLVFGFINETEKYLNYIYIPEVVKKLTLLYFEIIYHLLNVYEPLNILVNAKRFIAKMKQMHINWIATKYIATKFGHCELKKNLSLNLAFKLKCKDPYNAYVLTMQFNLSLEDIMNTQNEFDEPHNPYLQINALIKHKSMKRHLLCKTLRLKITNHFESSWIIDKDKSFTINKTKYVEHTCEYKFSDGWCDGTSTIDSFNFFLKHQQQHKNAVSIQIELLNTSTYLR